MADLAHLRGMIASLTTAIECSSCNSYILSGIFQDLEKHLDSPIFILTRVNECAIIGVFDTRRLAEEAREKRPDPSGIEINSFLIEDEV